mmetsp:Transcript_23257/g.56112  ORF Transcript_23257/g.56112 Transcript_23257/m.56112 type:complete len:322 (-) Transcript_23257:378-1343(-)
MSIVGILSFTADDMNGIPSGSRPNNELPAQYANVRSNVPNMTSENISPARGDMGDPTLFEMSPPSPMSSDGKKSAISTKIACCMLNLTRRLMEGFPARKFSAKNATNPEKGMDLYSAYSSASITTRGLAPASSAPRRNRPYCRPSINGNRYGNTLTILSDVVGSFSLRNSSLACARRASCSCRLDSCSASEARRFSSRARASSWLRNRSTVTNSSSWRAPSPEVSNTSISSFTRFSLISVLSSFSNPSFSSPKLTSPSELASNLLNALSAASASCFALSASNDAASARSFAAIFLRRSISLSCASSSCVLYRLVAVEVVDR